ncbi:MAG: NHLP bacteriocin export ABC transporter permease/ATPase subunit [Candidatus Riflebacteria bacterium]|nr:NHLP bacteriocin export ABC transporter permease/ATPase subunit [Candidatus Riflebacteria bacterium]
MNLQRLKYIQTLMALSPSYWSRETVEGNRPFFLNGQDRVWILESGHVDLFSVQVNSSGITSRRRHLARFEEGGCLFGFPEKPIADEYRIIAVGSLNTNLIVVSRRFLLKHLIDAGPSTEADSELLKEWLAEWIDRLTEGLLPNVPPRSSFLIEPGKTWEPTESQTARSQTIRWCRIRAGNLCWLGVIPLPIDPDHLFPLSSRGWIDSDGSGHLEVMLPDERLSVDELEVSLDSFFRATLITVRHLALKDRSRANERRRQRERESNKSEAEARKSLVQIPVAEEMPSFSTTDAEDPMLAAIRLIGGAVGFPLPRIRPVSTGRIFNTGRLSEITSQARVRYRRVLLSGEWWKQECGPMLACYEASKEPVALLPGSGGYRLVSPNSPEISLVVNDSIASQLNPFGYVFYRPLADRALSLLDVMIFGLRGSFIDFFQLISLSFLAMILSLSIPLITGILFDRAIPESNTNLLGECILALVVATVVSTIWNYARVFPILRSETRMNASIQAGILDRILRLPTEFFRQFSTGDLCSRAVSINEIRRQIGSVALDSLFQCIALVCNFGMMLNYNSRLCVWALGISLIGTMVFVGGGIVVRSYLWEQSNLQARQSSFILQLIMGIAKLKVAGAESRAFRLWSEIFSRKKRVEFKAGTWKNVLGTFESGFPLFGNCVIFFAAFDQLQKAQSAASDGLSVPVLSLGQFLAFNVSASVFISAMVALGGNILSILRIVPEIERMRPILTAIPEVTEQKGDPGELSGLIHISHVSFRYHLDGKRVLDDLSFHILPGEFVALVGPSGSGKSTLLRLLLGFEKPEGGGVLYDGRNLADLDVRAIRRQIGVVLQSGRLSAGSMFQLIAGNGQYTLNDAWEAARAAGFAADIEAMPMQMHTVIGDGGVTLSGGQRQRLLIARAMIKKPRIIFFDEATSALDNSTQAIVSESLDRLNATRVVIAHRLSTIQHADRIIVLQAGSVVESGTFEELMGRNGVFAELARRQMA